MRIMDAGWGKQGFFTLIQDGDQMFVHYNKQPDGYAVFKMRGMNEQKAQELNRYLAGVIERQEMVFTELTTTTKARNRRSD